MTDLDKAIDAAREALNAADNYHHALNDLLAALDAAQAPPAELAVQADFAEWLAREMPAGTVIGDPRWWAKLIARRFAQFASKEPAGAMFRHKESGRTRLVLEDEADDFEEMNATWTRVGAVYLSPSIKESAND